MGASSAGSTTFRVECCRSSRRRYSAVKEVNDPPLFCLGQQFRDKSVARKSCRTLTIIGLGQKGYVPHKELFTAQQQQQQLRWRKYSTVQFSRLLNSTVLVCSAPEPVGEGVEGLFFVHAANWFDRGVAACIGRHIVSSSAVHVPAARDEVTSRPRRTLVILSCTQCAVCTRCAC